MRSYLFVEKIEFLSRSNARVSNQLNTFISTKTSFPRKRGHKRNILFYIFFFAYFRTQSNRSIFFFFFYLLFLCID